MMPLMLYLLYLHAFFCAYPPESIRDIIVPWIMPNFYWFFLYVFRLYLLRSRPIKPRPTEFVMHMLRDPRFWTDDFLRGGDYASTIIIPLLFLLYYFLS